MDLGLADHRYLVAGGSRGLGAAIARALAGEGARVAAVARQSPDLASSVAAFGGVGVAADLSRSDGPAAAVREASAAFGGLDGIVVNSGGPPAGSFLELDEEAWSRAIEGTLQGAFRLIREALPHLRDGRDGAILVILSSTVREPIPGLVTSNVLRPGLVGLIKSLVDEIAPIRINGVAPGRFDTARVRSLDESRAEKSGMTVEEVRAELEARIPLGRYGDPDELGRVGAFLLSPAASYINGVVLAIDGGLIRSMP